ncbi:MAG: AzlD domain-containing protein [Thermoleophilia bacterium]
MKLALALVGMMLVTYVPRAVPLLLLADRRLPPRVLRFLEGFPVAVLAAFVAPLILAPEGRLDLTPGNLNLLVSVPVILLALRTRSIILTVVAGSVVMATVRALGL